MTAPTPAETRAFITCREVIDFLWAYLADELPPAKAREFERHLAACPSCVAYLATYRATVELGRGALTAGPENVPPELGVELARAILAQRG